MRSIIHRRLFVLIFSAMILSGASVAVAFADGLIGPIDPPDPGAARGADPTPSAGHPESSAAPAEAVAATKLPCTGVKQALNFPNFWAGKTLDGLPLIAVIRRCDMPRTDEPIRANYVSYIYGDCKAEDDAGCAPPIEVQNWPAAERNKRTLTPIPGRPEDPGADTTLAGLPATRYDDGTRVEIYHPSATVVIFGDDPARINRFATALAKAPAVLTELATNGIIFRDGCQDDVNYCAGGPTT
jgi:hypothetical protein